MRLDGQQIRSPFVARTKTRAARLLLGFPDPCELVCQRLKPSDQFRWFLRLKPVLCTNALDMKNNMMIVQNRKGTNVSICDRKWHGSCFFPISKSVGSCEVSFKLESVNITCSLRNLPLTITFAWLFHDTDTHYYIVLLYSIHICVIYTYTHFIPHKIHQSFLCQVRALRTQRLPFQLLVLVWNLREVPGVNHLQDGPKSSCFLFAKDENGAYKSLCFVVKKSVSLLVCWQFFFRWTEAQGCLGIASRHRHIEAGDVRQ